MKIHRSPLVTIHLLILALAVSGCASSGVIPMGPDTYMMSKTGIASTESLLKASLYREANEWCKQRGLVMIPVSEKTKNGAETNSLSSAEIVFRTVKEGSRETTQPPQGSSK